MHLLVRYVGYLIALAVAVFLVLLAVGTPESNQIGQRLVEIRQARVRYGETPAETGAAEALAVEQVAVDGRFRQPGLVGYDVGYQFQ